MHRNVAGALALVFAFTFTAAGCGGGGGSDQASAQLKTSADLVKRADAVCARFSKKSFAVAAEVSEQERQSHVTDEQLQARAIAKLAAIRRQELDALDALSPPSALKARLDSFVASQRQSVALALAEAKQSPDQPASAETDAISRKSAQLARAIGFKHCP